VLVQKIMEMIEQLRLPGRQTHIHAEHLIKELFVDEQRCMRTSFL
jgi:hypothetical protein